MAVLEDLVERYGNGVIVTVAPYVADSGETLRWVGQIVGEAVSALDVRERGDGDVRVRVLVAGDEEIDLARWKPDQPSTSVTGPRESVDPSAIS